MRTCLNRSPSSRSFQDDPEVARQDPQRLQALHETMLLDSPPEQSFDGLTQLAAKLTGAPIVFLVLVDSQRDFYKSQLGLPEPLATTRQAEGRSLCHYSLLSHDPLVLDEVLDFEHLADVPNAQHLGVRAYFGVPLRDEHDFALGTFCALDTQPRQWTALDHEVMVELAASAQREISLRRALHEAAQNLRSAQAEAQAREQVLAAVAHDLRAPLTTIMLSTELLARELPAERRAQVVERLQGTAQTMGRMVDEILEPAKLPSAVVHAVTPTSRLLDEVVALMQPIAQSNDVQLVLRSRPQLPSVKIERHRLLRVFSNLVGNAIKFSPPGSSVFLDAVPGHNELRFFVVDSGSGIAAVNQPHIFDRYWQADEDRRGIGLGLAIAKEIVEAHGGRIGVSSVLGQGSSFYFTVPATPAA